MTSATTRKQKLEYAYEAIDVNGYAVPTAKRGIVDNWKKARRNSTDYFRMMRSVWYSPWLSDKKSTLENFTQGLKKLGRLAWMTVGVVPAATTFAIQSTTKIPSVLGKKGFRKAGILVKNKNPFKKILGGTLYGIGAVLKGVDYANRPIYGLMGLATNFVFANTTIPLFRLDRRYGIRSKDPIITEDSKEMSKLKQKIESFVRNSDNLAALTKALIKSDFIRRTEAISEVMKDAGLKSNPDDGDTLFTDETIGQFLTLTKREIKKQEREAEKGKKIGGSQPFIRGLR